MLVSWHKKMNPMQKGKKIREKILVFNARNVFRPGVSPGGESHEAAQASPSSGLLTT